MIFNHQFKAFDTDIFVNIICKNQNCQNVIKKFEKSTIAFEKKFSWFDAKSELSRINQKTKPLIKVSDEMTDLLTKAKKFHKLTKGIFDPTIKSPHKFAELNLNTKQKILKSPIGFKMDLSGIAKGYWVDKISKILNKHSKNFWISAGGDIYLKGKDENKNFWEIGVQNPLDLNSDILTLKLPSNGIGIATSGITKRGYHIIDPLTHKPPKNRILSVTTLAKSTTNADVMAKTVLILGIKKGLDLINSMKDYECIIVDKNLKTYKSKGINKFL